ncbi:ORF6N domain-containing protein [Salmonella enterica subsp. enterica serovar Westminster]|nr:ORF6N domain-containing protein [Salmonella enterica subsp. enterica serovar Westminster]
MASISSVEYLSIVSYSNAPVITTELLAQLYGAEANNIHQNFKRNAERFIIGKHFFKLEGNELREFKNRLTSSQSVAKHARSLILWTERGAARHAKMLETDRAWEVFEKLEDFYFSQKEKAEQVRKSRQCTFTDEEFCALCWVWNAAEYMREKIELVYPALKVLHSDHAASFYSMAFEYKRTLDAGRKILERETRSIEPHLYAVSDESWRRVLSRLRQNGLPRM